MGKLLVLQTRGYCLSCLRKDFHEGEVDKGLLQSACDFLNVETRNLFSAIIEDENSSDECEFAATLCPECEELIAKIVEMKEELEALQIVFNECVKGIFEGISMAETDENVLENFRSEMISEAESIKCLTVVEHLRQNILRKCSKLISDGKSKPHLNLMDKDPVDMQENDWDSLPIIASVSGSYFPHEISKDSQANSHTTPILCCICLQQFSNNSDLIYHRKRVHMRAIHQCHYCFEIFISKRRLARHKKEVHKLQSSEANQTMKHFTRSKKFKCKFCVHRFRHKLLLARHKRKCHPELHLQCEYCPAIYYFTESLKRHKKIAHASTSNQFILNEVSSRRKFKCEFCLKEFTRKHHLKEHRNAIHLNILISCEKCNRKFRWKSSLRSHKCKKLKYNMRPRKKVNYNENSDDEREKCQQIHPPSNPKLSKAKANFNKKEKFNCNLCNRRFSHKLLVAQHKRNCHSEIFFKRKKENQKSNSRKSFTCDICYKVCTTRHNLITHWDAIHLNRWFKCDICPSQFASERGFLQHKCKEPKPEKLMTNRTTIKRRGEPEHLGIYFNCKFCKNYFKSRRSLYIHVRKKHKVNSTDHTELIEVPRLMIKSSERVELGKAVPKEETCLLVKEALSDRLGESE